MINKSTAKSIINKNMSRRINNLNRRWNIELQEFEIFDHFKNRILYGLNKVLGIFILGHPDFANRFAFYVGLSPISLANRTNLKTMITELDGLEKNDVYHYFQSIQGLPNLVRAIQYMIWVLEEGNYEATSIEKSKYREDFIEEVRQAINITPGINLNLIKSNNSALEPIRKV